MTRAEADKVVELIRNSATYAEVYAMVDKPEKPKHYDGEPCNLPVIHGTLPEGCKLVYTGKFLIIPAEHCEWHESEYREGVCFGWSHNPKWILRAVPVEPQWKVGDWAYHLVWNCIVKIDGLEHYDFARTQDLTGNYVSGSTKNLRPLLDSDWVREVGGVKVRAYEDACGKSRLRGDGVNWGFGQNEDKNDKIFRELCRLASIPIMPYSLSKGEYKAPV